MVGHQSSILNKSKSGECGYCGGRREEERMQGVENGMLCGEIE